MEIQEQETLEDFDAVLERIKTFILEAEAVHSPEFIVTELATVFSEVESIFSGGVGDTPESVTYQTNKRKMLITGLDEDIRDVRRKKPISFLQETIIKEKKINIDSAETFIRLLSRSSHVLLIAICSLLIYASLWAPIRMMMQIDKFVDFLDFKESGLFLEITIYSLLAPVVYLLINSTWYNKNGHGYRRHQLDLIIKEKKRLLIGLFLLPFFGQVLLNFPEIFSALDLNGIASAFKHGRNILLGNGLEKLSYGIVVVLYSVCTVTLYSDVRKSLMRTDFHQSNSLNDSAENKKSLFPIITVTSIAIILGLICGLIIWNRKFGLVHKSGTVTKYNIIEKVITERFGESNKLLGCVTLQKSTHPGKQTFALISKNIKEEKIDGTVMRPENFFSSSQSPDRMLDFISEQLTIDCDVINRYLSIRKTFEENRRK